MKQELKPGWNIKIKGYAQQYGQRQMGREARHLAAALSSPDVQSEVYSNFLRGCVDRTLLGTSWKPHREGGLPEVRFLPSIRYPLPLGGGGAVASALYRLAREGSFVSL